MKRRPPKPNKRRSYKAYNKSWEKVADWYDGMVGEEGSKFHRHQIIPTVMKLLSLKPGQKVIEFGCGQGVLAEYVSKAGGQYLGVELSPRLIQIAKKRKIRNAEFLKASATGIPKEYPGLRDSYDAAVFMLSINDINPLDKAIESAEYCLKDSGKLVIFMTHPAFRIPRQSGWGEDKNRKLIYRRVDTYLSRLDIPMRANKATQKNLTWSHHRPLQDYMGTLIQKGFVIDRFLELPTYKLEMNNNFAKSEKRAYKEIPLFLSIRGTKVNNSPKS